jgi:ligand-binding sensor domain-containing protein
VLKNVLHTILILFVPVSWILAQGIDVTRVELISNRNGLPSNRISDIVQDHQGYIWISSDDGLTRYDGYNFKVFRHIQNDSTSLQSNQIYNLSIDKNGFIWCALFNGRITYFDPANQRFINYNGIKMGLPDELITKIFFDTSGKLWVCVGRNGLYFFDNVKKAFFHAGDLPGIHPAYKADQSAYLNYNSIYDVAEDEDGIFWMATHNGLYNFNQYKLQFTEIRERPIKPFTNRKDLYTSILIDSSGFWLCAYGGGLSYYNKKTKQWSNYDSPTSFNFLARKSNEELWVSTNEKGWGIFNIIKKEFSFPELSVKAACSRIMVDKSGVVWVASNYGIFKYISDSSAPLFEKVNVNGPYVYESYQTDGFYHDLKRKKLYYGTSHADGLHIRNEATGKEKTVDFPLPKKGGKALDINHLYNDNLDTLWLLTVDRIYILNKQTEKLVRFHEPPLDPLAKRGPFFSRILRSKTRDVWIGTGRIGLFRYNSKTGEYHHYVHEPNNIYSLSSNYITGIQEDNHNRIWITSPKGVTLFNYTTEKFERILFNEQDSTSIDLGDIAKSSNGDIWLSTFDNGLFQYENSSTQLKFKHWTIDEQLPSNAIYSLTTSDKGLVWGITPTSFFSIDPQRQEIKTYPFYSLHSGMDMYSDPKGKLYLESYGGFFTFNPYADSLKSVPPQLALNSFKVFDRDIVLSFDSAGKAHVNLDYDENFISFEFAILDFKNPNHNQYAYKLGGINDHWVNGAYRRSNSYANLAPGDYVLQLKGANSDNVWSEHPISIDIHIAKPFWQTFWFNLIVFSVVILSALGIYQFKIHQIRKEESVKREFNQTVSELEMKALRAQINPHFIFNCLNSINRYILVNKSSEASKYLTKFSSLIRIILENSNYKTVTVASDISALKLYLELESLRFNNRFDYTIVVNPELDTEIAHIMPMIIQPFVENAIWHGLNNKKEKGEIKIHFDIDDATIKCTVEDNGVGRQQAADLKENVLVQTRSMGMRITSQRLSLLNRKELHSKHIEITDLYDSSGQPRGTRVQLLISTF